MKVEILTVEQLLRRTQRDILGPFLGGFATLTVAGVKISGGIVANIRGCNDKKLGQDDAEAQKGIRIEFATFVYVKQPQGDKLVQATIAKPIDFVERVEID